MTNFCETPTKAQPPQLTWPSVNKAARAGQTILSVDQLMMKQKPDEDNQRAEKTQGTEEVSSILITNTYF